MKKNILLSFSVTGLIKAINLNFECALKSVSLLVFSAFICFNAHAQYTKLYDFNPTSGYGEPGGLTLSNNTLYGMAKAGGAYNMGTIYKINADGSGFQKLFDFSGTNGSNPWNIDPLTLSGNVLYGTVTNGGAYGKGVIFKINTDGSGFQKLQDFSGTNGDSPSGSLTLSDDNVLYGMTSSGGANANGVIYKINTDGSGYQILFDFPGSTGYSPTGSLILSGNILYGRTGAGGFKINTDGSGFQKLFDDLWSFSSLTLSGNVLYGITGGGAYGNGGIFKINTDGSGFQELFDFSGTNGDCSFRGTLTAVDNILYGTTYDGASGGVLFKINTDGSGFQDLFYFSDTTGRWPEGSLAVSGNVLYGTTDGGGAIAGDGVIFSYRLAPQINLPTTKASAITSPQKNETISDITSVAPEIALKVYPNPTPEAFTMDLKLSKVQSASIKIYNSYGAYIKGQQVSGQSEYHVNFDMSQNPSGVYYIHVSSNTGNVVERVSLIR